MARRGGGRGGSLAGLIGTFNLFKSTFRGVERLQSGVLMGLGYKRPRPTEGYFNEGLWAENSTYVIDQQLDKAGNPGQEALLGGSFRDAANDSCQRLGEDYNAQDFINDIEFDLGDNFSAISEITEECAVDLYEAWDYSYAGDNVGPKLFGQQFGLGKMSPATISWMKVAGSLSNSAIRQRNARTARTFLSNNPKGRPRVGGL